MDTDITFPTSEKSEFWNTSAFQCLRYNTNILKYLQTWIFAKEDKFNHSYGLIPEQDKHPARFWKHTQWRWYLFSRISWSGGKDWHFKPYVTWEIYKGASAPKQRHLGRLNWVGSFGLVLKDTKFPSSEGRFSLDTPLPYFYLEHSPRPPYPALIFKLRQPNIFQRKSKTICFTKDSKWDSFKVLILGQVFSLITNSFNFNHFKAIFLFKI